MVLRAPANQGSRRLSERPSPLRAARLDDTFAALSDRTRRGIVDLLRREPMRAGALSRALEVSPAALSRHLRVLREAGLVLEESFENDARVRVYTLRREPFEGLRSWVDEVTDFWTGQLASFKAHAERTRPPPKGKKR